MTHSEVIQVVASWFKQKNEVELVSRFSPGFPEPDVYVQYKNNKTAQIECKPSNANGREYLTGFGQAISYFTQSDYSYLALPYYELEKYKQFFWVEHVGLLSVAEGAVNEIRASKTPKIEKSKSVEIKRSYAYYRDLTPLEIYQLVKCIEVERNKNIFEKVKLRNALWEKAIKLRKWKGSKSSHLANISLLLRDLKLLNTEDYSLLENGEELIKSGDKQDLKSVNLKVTKYFLLNGNFIDIIALMQELNDDYFSFLTIDDFKEKLVQKILAEKMATKKTDVPRDLRDVFSILHKLKLISEWPKGKVKRKAFSIYWKNIFPHVKFR